MGLSVGSELSGDRRSNAASPACPPAIWRSGPLLAEDWAAGSKRSTWALESKSECRLELAGSSNNTSLNCRNLLSTARRGVVGVAVVSLCVFEMWKEIGSCGFNKLSNKEATGSFSGTALSKSTVSAGDGHFP